VTTVLRTVAAVFNESLAKRNKEQNNNISTIIIIIFVIIISWHAQLDL